MLPRQAGRRQPQARQRIFASSESLNVQLVDQRAHSPLDVIPNRPDLLERLAGGILELPIDVTAAGGKRAFVAAPHRDDDVGRPKLVVKPAPWPLAADVDALLAMAATATGLTWLAGS